MKQRLLSIPDLPSLLYVGFVSYVVRWLETLAFALFAYQATQSAFVVVMLTMLRLLPMGLFGAFIGSAAGRHDLRHALALVVGTSGLVTLVLAWFIDGERPTVRALVGGLLAVAGAVKLAQLA